MILYIMLHTYRYLQYYYRNAMELLQKYYGITTAPLQHYGLQSVHVSTCHYSDYGLRGKIPQFADDGESFLLLFYCNLLQNFITFKF